MDFIELKIKYNEVENHRLKSEMKYLRLKLNPHFLFNTLNNIYFLAKTKSNLAPEVIERLSVLMRYMLEKSEEELVLLTDEIEFITSYLELEKIRIKFIKVDFEISGNTSQKYIPPLLFMPLIENIFKHGIDKSSEHNYVLIKLTICENDIYLYVENSVPLQYTANPAGLGLSTLKKRLHLLYPEYNLSTGLQNDRFISKLKIPLS